VVVLHSALISRSSDTFAVSELRSVSIDIDTVFKVLVRCLPTGVFAKSIVASRTIGIGGHILYE